MLALKRFFPVAGSKGNRVRVEAPIANGAPAAVTGGARVGRPTCHATCIELAPTETAYKPSLHGTKTIDPSHAVPPHAPLQTRRLASWPPIPPRAPIRSKYPTPSLPITKPRSIDGINATPVDPRSTSPAFNAGQFAGAK